MPVRVQCPISSSLGEFPSYWDWLWHPGLSPVLVSITLPFAFHTWCFPFARICHCISIVFLLYDRRIATHSVDPSLTHCLGEFPGFGMAKVPDVLVPEADSGANGAENSIQISALANIARNFRVLRRPNHAESVYSALMTDLLRPVKALEIWTTLNQLLGFYLERTRA